MTKREAIWMALLVILVAIVIFQGWHIRMQWQWIEYLNSEREMHYGALVRAEKNFEITKESFGLVYEWAVEVSGRILLLEYAILPKDRVPPPRPQMGESAAYDYY